MGKAKWWVCESCKSLNDLPANKCYNCRAEKTSTPSLIDDQYAEVGGGQQRVGITVDLSQVSDLVRRDPIETQAGGSVMEAFGDDDDQPLEMSRSSGQTPDSTRGQTTAPPPPPPMRDPTPRGIAAVGGRQWTDEPDPPPPLPPPPPVQAGPPQAGPPQADAPPPPPQTGSPQGHPPMLPPAQAGPPPQTGSPQGHPPMPPPPPGAPPPPGYAPPPPPGLQGRPPMPPPPGTPMPPPPRDPEAND